MKSSNIKPSRANLISKCCLLSSFLFALSSCDSSIETDTLSKEIAKQQPKLTQPHQKQTQSFRAVKDPNNGQFTTPGPDASLSPRSLIQTSTFKKQTEASTNVSLESPTPSGGRYMRLSSGVQKPLMGRKTHNNQIEMGH